ncbi:MliC family protein [Aliiroseovarius crassostreae]|uniref:MliC family protein n=1 Tax=Aliiroseovarius crassostreae TaxID=154981 RepID=UPI003C7BD765
MNGDVYDCARGAVVQATYMNAGDASYAVVLVEGRQVGMDRVQSASGAKYAQIQEDGKDAAGYVWWTKGDEAFLLWVDPDTGTDDMILTGCKAR